MNTLEQIMISAGEKITVPAETTLTELTIMAYRRGMKVHIQFHPLTTEEKAYIDDILSKGALNKE